MAFKKTSERSEGLCCDEEYLGRGNGKHKGLEAGTCLVCLRNSKETNVVDAEWSSSRVAEDKIIKVAGGPGYFSEPEGKLFLSRMVAWSNEHFKDSPWLPCEQITMRAKVEAQSYFYCTIQVRVAWTGIVKKQIIYMSCRKNVEQSAMFQSSIPGENSKHFCPLHLGFEITKENTTQSSIGWNDALPTERRGRVRSAPIVTSRAPQHLAQGYWPMHTHLVLQ